MKICIKNGNIISMDESKDYILYNTDVLIDGNKIIKIDKNINVDENTQIINADNKVVIPGLINAHAHVPMSIFRETLDGYNLQDWLSKKIWPMEDKLMQEDIYYASYLTYLEMIKSGVTTINDMYFMTDEIISSALDSGIRLQTTRTFIGSNKKDLERLEELDTLIGKYKEDTITFNLGIHGLYTTTSSFIDECLEFNKKHNLNIHMHFCENEKEVSDIKNTYNLNPVDILEGKFNNQKLILAHCVKLTKEDIIKLSKLNVSVVHCPVSNLKLGCGIANINEMLNNNINVCLGTDGQGSGSNLDLFEVMKFTALLQKGINENAKLLPSYEVLKMATINGAKALNLSDKIGSIEVGKLADIIIIDIDDIKIKPVNNLLSEIVYNVKSNNVETTIINGKILMKNKTIINNIESRIVEQCNKIVNRISDI